MPRFGLIAALSLVLLGCQSPPSSESASDATPSSPDPAHTTRNAVDWNGTYHGVVPCADCVGIDTLLTLNPDGSYLLERRYIGKDTTWFAEQGDFTWQPNGLNVALDMAGDDRVHVKVGENQVWFLNDAWQQITSPLADVYRLERAPEQHHWQNRVWRLMSLEGEAIKVEGKRPFFQIEGDTNRVSGIAGCNRFFGEVQTAEASHLTFGMLASTKMACPNLALEDQFLSALNGVAAYSLKGHQMTLLDADGSTVAIFEQERN